MTYYLLNNHVKRDVPRKKGVGRPWYTTRQGAIRVGVIHTAENLPDYSAPDGGAEAVVKYGASTERASWHTTSDSDTIIDMLPWSYTAFHVHGYNSISVGLEIATKAALWVDTPLGWRLSALDKAAEVVARWNRELFIPIRFITRADVDAGMMGITAHALLDPTRRGDPGSAFPWDYLLNKAKQYANVPPQPVAYSDRKNWAPWAEAAIESVIENGWMRGYEVTDSHTGQKTKIFKPDQEVTRQELAVALDRVAQTLRKA